MDFFPITIISTVYGYIFYNASLYSMMIKKEYDMI